MGPAALLPIALLLLFGGRGSSRRSSSRTPQVRRTDPLQEFARERRAENRAVVEIPRSEIREYQSPIQPAPLWGPEPAPIPYAPPPPAAQWNPEQQPPPFAPPEGAFYPPPNGAEYPPPAPEASPPPAPEAPPPAAQWEPIGNQATRQQAARALAQHLLTTRGAARDRQFIRQMQGILGIRVDGLVGNQTLNAIAQYGNLTAQERAALTPEA